MAEAQFQNFTPLNPNSAEKASWEALRQAFQDHPCIAYFRYPIYKRVGDLLKEPDIVLMHRQLGLWIFECKGCYINNIESIQGHVWTMRNWHREEEQPSLQAEEGMYAVESKLSERRETRRLVSCHYRVILPFIDRHQWQEKGFADLPCTQGVVLLKEDLKPASLREKLEIANQESPQRPLSDEQWQHLLRFFGGSLPRREPRPVPAGAAPENPLRVIHHIESQLRFLDGNQQKVAFEIPEGPQRIRGLAGSGKTVLLAKRAARMHASHPDWQIAFVFFTRSLYDQITELIRLYYREMVRLEEGEAEPDWNNLHILHAWGAWERQGFYRRLAERSGISPMALWEVKKALGRSSCSPGEAFEYVCDALEKKKGESIPVLYDAILIDEGQDLPPSFYRLAYKSLSDPRRLYWAYDEAQGIGSLIVPQPKTIFGYKPDGTPVVDLGGNKLPNGTITSPVYEGGIQKAHNLNRCYRTPKLLLMVAHAINMGLLRSEGPLQGVSDKKEWRNLGYVVFGDFRKVGSEVTITYNPDLAREDNPNPEPGFDYGPHPIDRQDFSLKEALGSPLVIETFASEAEERAWIAEQIKKDLDLGFRPEDLMVTGPTGDYEKDYFVALKAQLAKLGVQAVIAGVDTSPDDFRWDGHVTLSTIARAKGNEAWKVYACRFQYATRPLSWKKETELHKRNEAFVALTRTRVWCVVTGIELGSAEPIFSELRKAKEQYPKLTFKVFNRKSLKRIQSEDENELELVMPDKGED